MKLITTKISGVLAVVLMVFLFAPGLVQAQDDGADAKKTEETEKPKKKDKPVRSPWAAGTLIETQTYFVLPKNTLEFVIQHRFGVLNSGTFDLAGIYAPSNIRIGFNYGIFKNAQIGIGTTKDNMLQDFNWKYKILTQTRSGRIPLAITYFGNVQFDVRKEDNFGSDYKFSHRMAWFNQIMIGRKFAKAFSMQISGSYAHYNLIDSVRTPGLKHDNFAVGIAMKIRVSSQLNIILEYDQPIGTPDFVKPNASLGIEIETSSHAFEIFVTTYSGISYQKNLMYNTNEFYKGTILLGFNMNRIWSF